MEKSNLRIYLNALKNVLNIDKKCIKHWQKKHQPKLF